MALCVWTAHEHAPRIEADLEQRLGAIIAPAPTLAPTVDGRDVTLTGRVLSQTESVAMRDAIDCLVRTIGQLEGVRSVHTDISMAPSAAPLAAARTDAGGNSAAGDRPGKS